MTALETFKPQLTSQKEISPAHTEALDLMMAGAKGAGCARPSEPSVLEFGAIGQGGGGAKGPSHPGNEKTDRVEGSKGDSDSIGHHKDRGCALPSNPDFNFDDFGKLGGGGGGAKGPGDDIKHIDGKDKDTNNESVHHKNLDFDIENLKDPVRKNPPHRLDGVCFTPNFDKPQTEPPKFKNLPVPVWKPVS